MTTKKEHFVEFLSPGTFFSETSCKPILSWDTKLATNMAKNIVERHNAQPYGFQFVTKLTHNPIPDDLGTLEVKSKEIERSGTYFITGKLRTLDDVRRDKNKNEKILLSNMEGNGYYVIIENKNSYLTTMPFTEKDIIVDWHGEIIKRGNDKDLIDYRKIAKNNLDAERKRIK